jgi:hypothetical protein
MKARSLLDKRGLRIRDHARWLIIGQAITDYIGNDKRETIQVVADRYGLKKNALWRAINIYRGRGKLPVLIRFDMNTGEAKETNWIRLVMEGMG